MTDFNGDGVLDFVRLEFDVDEFSRMRVWYGTGGGRYEPEFQMGNVPFADTSELHLADVNRDGLTDVIRVSGTWAALYLNDGRHRFTGQVATVYGLPSRSYVDEIYFVDMNGNGTADIVWLGGDGRFANRLSYLDFMPEPNPGLLARVDNGMGLVTQIAYRSAVQDMIEAKQAGTPWATSMPIAVSVIAEMSTTDSLDQLGVPATETRTTYRYYDGYYDGPEREFRGFARVEVTAHGDDHHPTSVVETRYHVGRNLETGDDEEPLKGKAYLSIVRDGQGRIFTTTETEWTWGSMCQEDFNTSLEILPRCSQGPPQGAGIWQQEKDFRVSIARTEGSVTGIWEGGTHPRFTASRTLEYDEWNRAVESIGLGEVRFAGGHPLLGHGGGSILFEHYPLLDMDRVIDVRIDPQHGWEETPVKNRMSFADDLLRWRIGLVTDEQTLREDGTTLNHSRIYYDGAAFEGLPLGTFTNGWPTRVQTLLVDENGERWIDSTRTAYNADGLVTATLNALDQRGELVYDTNTGMLAVEERVLLHDRSFAFSATYDEAFGTVQTATDANGEVSEYRYDGLGRATEVYDPLTRGTSTPSLVYRYEFGTQTYPLSTTRIHALTSLSEGEYHESVSYSDAAGRGRLNKTESEIGYIGSGWALTTQRGSPYLVYDSFVSSHAGFEPAPADAPSNETWFDVMGRAVQARAPATETLSGLSAVTQYFPFEVRTYDERSVQDALASGDAFRHPTITRTDGFGRVREVQRENDRPEGGIPQFLRWRTDYDELSRINHFVDPEGHERFYDYDNVGRLRSVDDPNLGFIEYTYDVLGNLRSRLGALGHEESWQYDDANRVTQYELHHADGRPSQTFTYHFDEPDPSGPFATASHMVGRLSYVTFPTGAEHIRYDRVGRIDAEEHELWDGLSPLEDQVRTRFRREADFTVDGRVTQTRLPGGFQTDFGYNTGLLVEHADAGFGASDRRIVEQIDYDHRGQITSSVLGNGIRACRRYDDRGQITGILSGRTPDITHCGLVGTEGLGQQHLVYERTHNGLIAHTFDYSESKEALPRRGASYRYDRIGQLIESQTDTDGTIGFAYDTVQNLVARTHQGGAGIDVPVGDMGYGEATLAPAGPNMVTSVPDPASPTGRTHLEYDAAGQLRRYHGFGLIYDAAGRLEYANRVEGDEQETIEFFYDAWGERRLTRVSTSDVSMSGMGTPAALKVYRRVFGGYEERDQHRIWRTGAGADSAEVTSFDGVDVTLDLLDQLQRYVDAPEDGVKPLPVEFLDLNEDGVELDQADVDAAWAAFAAEERIGGRRDVWRMTHADQLTTVTLATDSVGDVVGHTSWYPYGEEEERYGLKTSVGFAGVGAPSDPLEALGLIQMGARFYAPALGRWITPDRFIGESPERMVGNPLESNLFSYARNNPILLRDPSGKESTSGGDVSLTQRALNTLVDAETFAVDGLEKVGNALKSAYKEAGRGIRQGRRFAIDKAEQAVENVAGETAGDAAKAYAALATSPLLVNAALADAASEMAGSGLTAPKRLDDGIQTTAQGISTGDRAMTVRGILGSLEAATEIALSVVGAAGAAAEVKAGIRSVKRVATRVARTGGAAGPKCFGEGTLVATEDGLRPIEEVEVGDFVWARDDETGEEGWKPVVQVVVTPDTEVLELTFEAEDGTEQVLRVTADHPIWSLDDGVWDEAGHLDLGEQVDALRGPMWLVNAVALSATETVYNFEVEDSHTYFVGETGAWVHNNNCSAAGGGGRTFKNLFPDDVPGNPVTLTTSQLDKAENVFLYVVREDGALVIGPRSVGGVKQSHIDLAAGGNVRAAGQVKILKGRAHEIDNLSGHYKPSGTSARDAALRAFERGGYNPHRYREHTF